MTVDSQKTNFHLVALSCDRARQGQAAAPRFLEKLFAPARARILALLPRPGRRIRRALNVLFGALLATQNDQSQE